MVEEVGRCGMVAGLGAVLAVATLLAAVVAWRVYTARRFRLHRSVHSRSDYRLVRGRYIYRCRCCCRWGATPYTTRRRRSR